MEQSSPAEMEQSSPPEMEQTSWTMEQSGGDGAEQSDGDDDGSVRRTEQCGGRSGAQTEHEVDSILGRSSARKRKVRAQT
ncbi:unnamed protein product [Rhodiola kirilowii]